MTHRLKQLNNSKTIMKAALLSSAAFTLIAPSLSQAAAQNASESSEDSRKLETIVITGSRATIQDAIDLKRTSTMVVDGLSANDIGELPALSIGEALESITGAASHRENGGATEISIRGLGPYLSSTTFNGREASNGSGDRSVNFSQFPSELMNKLLIYKTQDASLIEGAVAGQIALETLKPLDYKKRRFQFDLKGNYNPDQQDIASSMAGDIGHRFTASYVDQFDAGGLGLFGLSLGGQISDISQPEQEQNSSSPSGTSIYACLIDPTNNSTGYYGRSSADCEDNITSGLPDNLGYQTEIDPNTGLAIDHGIPYAFASSSRSFRQNDTHDTRDSLFTALQWQPNDRIDINLDLQWSERIQSEDRYILNFSNMKRNTVGVTLPSLVVSDTGVVSNWSGQTFIESNGEMYERAEEYFGGGLSAKFEITDNLRASTDISFSETKRTELQVSLRTSSGARQLINWNRENSLIDQYTITNFDVTDPSNFYNDIYARIDNDVDRKNTNDAIRVDFDYDVGLGPINNLDFGIRFSELGYKDIAAGGTTANGSRVQYDLVDSDPSAAACAVRFAEGGFLESARSGDLLTNVSSTGTIIGSANSWATFDNACLTSAILAANGISSLTYPTLTEENSDTSDVTEKTTAAYIMANYESQLAGKAVRGNFGVRAVNTEVESIGYRNGFNIETDTNGNITLVPTAGVEKVSANADYVEFLPSFNAVIDLSDDVILRGGIYRGLSRANPSDMNYARSFTANNDDTITDPNELISGVNASGNPDSQPLTSWNFDVSAEWYPNEDSILSAAVYFKRFKGGFERVVANETYVIDGQSITIPVVLTQTNEDTSDLMGIELTASHNFSYLPGLLSGLGAKLSYNYAESDFEFEDSLYGDLGYTDENGNFVQTNIGIIPPGNIPGFSENVFSGQVYYQIGNFDSSLIYKFRSDYFQPYTGDGTRLRFVGDVGVWEARASYKMTDNFSVYVEGLNLFEDAPKEQYYFTSDNLGEVNVYGPRIFFGIKAKF